MTLFGVDLSDYDAGRGPVDVASMVADGMRLVTHKLTEGTSWRHANAGPVLTRARDLGVPYLGGYVVPRTPGSGGAGSVSAQVDYALAYAEQVVPWWRTYPGWCWQVDTEHWGYDDVAPVYGAQMCALLARRTGRGVLHYAPRWAYGDTIPGDEALWSSAYGSNPATGYRDAYRLAGGDSGPGWAAYSGRTPLVWQYGSRCTIGSQPGCDANAVRDEARLRAVVYRGDDMTTAADLRVKLLLEDWNPTKSEWLAAGGDAARWDALIADGSDPAGPNKLHARLAAIQARVDALATGGIDLDALAAQVAGRLKLPSAAEVAEELARRLGNG